MLKSPEAVLLRALLASPAVARIFGRQIYAVLAPRSASFPFATYQRTGIDREQTLGSPMGVPTVTVSYEIFGQTYEQAREAADAIRSTLDGYGGSALGCTVSQVALDNESDDFVTLQGGDLPPAYQITMTFDVWWQES